MVIALQTKDDSKHRWRCAAEHLDAVTFESHQWAAIVLIVVFLLQTSKNIIILVVETLSSTSPTLEIGGVQVIYSIAPVMVASFACSANNRPSLCLTYWLRFRYCLWTFNCCPPHCCSTEICYFLTFTFLNLLFRGSLPFVHGYFTKFVCETFVSFMRFEIVCLCCGRHIVGEVFVGYKVFFFAVFFYFCCQCSGIPSHILLI